MPRLYWDEYADETVGSQLVGAWRLDTASHNFKIPRGRLDQAQEWAEEQLAEQADRRVLSWTPRSDRHLEWWEPVLDHRVDTVRSGDMWGWECYDCDAHVKRNLMSKEEADGGARRHSEDPDWMG